MVMVNKNSSSTSMVQGLGFRKFHCLTTYLWLVGNGKMVVIVVIIVPHSFIFY